MEQKSTQGMPIYLQMALAHNVPAMHSFLKLDDKSQDEIIEKARNATTKNEIQAMVNELPKMHLR